MKIKIIANPKHALFDYVGKILSVIEAYPTSTDGSVYTVLDEVGNQFKIHSSYCEVVEVEKEELKETEVSITIDAIKLINDQIKKLEHQIAKLEILTEMILSSQNEKIKSSAPLQHYYCKVCAARL